MRLSACYIVKDETDELRKSLQSVSQAADEIIVVLTTDAAETEKIAREEGALLYKFPWQNDFSKARNFALDKADGDWLICIDADEYFLQPDKVREAITELIEQDADTDAIFIIRKEIYSMDRTEGMGSQLMARIFRNDPNLRYYGCIHEMMAWSDGHALHFSYADNRLTINHSGYEPSRMPEKTKRNLELLESDAAKNGKGLFHSFYLADCYFALGQYGKALNEALIILKSDFTAVGFNGKCYHMAIECMRKLNLPLQPMLELADCAIMRLPNLPDFYAERGMILCAMGRLESARATFIKAAELYEAKAYEYGRESSFFSTLAASRLYHRLGKLVLILDNDEEGAAVFFAKAMQEDSSLPQVRRDYDKYCQKQKLLSACYIVRNEADNLAKSLASIAGKVDELIVVDTGSTDDTVAIAQRAGAKVVQIEWQDDFAAARNVALQQAQGDWILFLDADEYFYQETAKNLRQYVQGQKEANLLMIYMRNIDRQTGQSMLDFYAPRLFRRQAGLHYVGRIHEQLRVNDQVPQPLVCVEPSVLTLIHTGYSAELSQGKAERNLQMLLAEMKSTKTPEQLYMYLAETYDGLGQLDKAMHYARLDIESGKKMVSYASRSYRILLRILAERPAVFQERAEIAQQACRDFPELPDFHAEQAECLAYALDFAGAVQEAELTLKLLAAYHGIEPCMFSAEDAQSLRHRKQIWEAVLKRERDLKISACLIAANAEHDLPIYLDNTAVFSDERIIVDSGSVDNTLSIVQAAGCRVINRPWDDDFSAARNAALTQAQGDWALVMDADEYIHEPEKVRAFLAFLDITRPDIDAVMVTIINIDEDDENRELYRFPYTRFLRLKRNLYYKGRIHEQLVKPLGKVNLYQEDYRITILHTGYSTRRVQEKLKRNLELLQLEIQEQGEKPMHYRYLAETYLGMGKTELALDYAQKAIQAGPAVIGTQGDMYYLVWQCMAILEFSYGQQDALADRAIEKFPEIPDFWGIKGIVAYDMGADEQAGQCLSRAVDLFTMPTAATKASSSNFASIADEVYWRLADLTARMGKQDKADEYWASAWQLNRHNVNLLHLYVQWHRNEKPAVLAEEIWSKYGRDKVELPFLARFAERYGWLQLYGLWSEKMGKNIPVIYQQYAEMQPEKFFQQKLLPSMVRVMQDIPAVLIKLEQNPSLSAQELLAKCEKLLPVEMAQVWQAYQGNTVNFRQASLDRFADTFKCWGNKEQIARFQQLYLHSASDGACCREVKS